MRLDNKKARLALHLLGYSVDHSPNRRTDLRWHVKRNTTRSVFELVCRSPVEALAYFEDGKMPREYYVRETML